MSEPASPTRTIATLREAMGPEELADTVRASPDIVRLYANGFALGLTNADAHIVLQMFGRPIAVLNLSYTLAKTLSEKLQVLVNEWETKTGKEIVTTGEIDRLFKLKSDGKDK